MKRIALLLLLAVSVSVRIPGVHDPANHFLFGQGPPDRDGTPDHSRWSLPLTAKRDTPHGR